VDEAAAAEPESEPEPEGAPVAELAGVEVRVTP
jgi:hypothetical protein